MPIVSLTATIGPGQSLSNAVDFGTNFVVGLIMPAAWTNAHVSILVSTDNIKYFDLFSFDPPGTTATEFKFNVTPNAIVAVNPERLLMGRYIKLRSGTRAEPVPQQATRVFGVVVNSKVYVQLLPAEA